MLGESARFLLKNTKLILPAMQFVIITVSKRFTARFSAPDAYHVFNRHDKNLAEAKGSNYSI